MVAAAGGVVESGDVSDGGMMLWALTIRVDCPTTFGTLESAMAIEVETDNEMMLLSMRTASAEEEGVREMLVSEVVMVGALRGRAWLATTRAFAVKARVADRMVVLSVTMSDGPAEYVVPEVVVAAALGGSVWADGTGKVVAGGGDNGGVVGATRNGSVRSGIGNPAIFSKPRSDNGIVLPSMTAALAEGSTEMVMLCTVMAGLPGKRTCVPIVRAEGGLGSVVMVWEVVVGACVFGPVTELRAEAKS